MATVKVPPIQIFFYLISFLYLLILADRHCDRLMVLEGLMKSRPFVATAGGLFPVDCTLIYTLVATIATYTVILYQMKDY